jgi:glycosyltransferase involved in cell wall biosynthesis
MRTVIDLQAAQTPFSRNREVGRYTIELVKAMARNRQEHEIILALNGSFPDTIETIRAEFDGILPQENIKVWQQFFDTSAINPQNIWRKKTGEILREEFLNSLEGDIIFSTNLQEGFFEAACTSVKILPTDSLICTTLHDVTPLISPNVWLRDSIIRAWYEEKISFVKKSDIIITDSNSSRAGINTLMGVPLKKIHIVYPAVNHAIFRPGGTGTNIKNDLLSRINVSRPFVLSTGGSDSHKNLNILYSAFSRLPRTILLSYQLVIVGDGFKREEKNQRKKLRKLGINDNVVFTGRLDDEELAMLYNSCNLFIFCSTHGGFGIPLIEAMACGAAVLASNASSLPEIVGHKDALFEPFDEVDIEKKIEHALTDSNFRVLLKEHGINQAGKFSWENSANALLTLLEESIKNKGLIHSSSSRHDPIQNVIDNVAFMSSNLSFDDKDLIALSASIAETFCARKDHRPRLFVDMSAIIKQDYRTGIQRVARAICNELVNNPQKIDIELVYTTPNDSEFYRANALMNKISSGGRVYGGDQWIEFCPGDILLFLDFHPAIAISHKNKTQFLRNKGILVYHVVHDILPVTNPEFFWPGLCLEFYEWLLAVSDSDGAICPSRAVAAGLSDWLKANGPKRLRPFKIHWSHWGADLENSVPTCGLPDDVPQILAQLAARPSFLMVGTVEPRKGHMQTIAAFDRLWEKGFDVNLVIVGRAGWINLLQEMPITIQKIVDALRQHSELGKHLFWLEAISDEYLERVYAVSTCLIAASEGEGFGLPLIEAARHKLPIIARDIPVFREVAGDSAYYFSSKSAIDLAYELKAWLALYQSGQHPKSDAMPWLTWKQSTKQLLDLILQERGHT